MAIPPLQQRIKFIRESIGLDIHYKGFSTRVLYDSRAGVFYGTLTLNRDIIAFQAKKLVELEITMQEAINYYVAVASKREEGSPAGPVLSCNTT